MRAPWRPLAITAAIGAVALAAVLLSARTGWLGPDVGRGDSFCEAARPGWIRQPVNTWSNLGFMVAGLAIAWHARRPSGWLPSGRGLTTALAVVVTLLGPASMAMHATQSALGGRLDLLSMYLIAGFAFAYALTRVLRRGAGTFAAAFGASLLVCELVENLHVTVPVVHNGANLAFAVLLLVAILLEVVLIRRRRSPGAARHGYAALAILLVAFAIWKVAQSDSPWCDPWSLLQGHGLWHLLDALAAYLLYRYYVKAGPTESPPMRPREGDSPV